MSKKNQSKIVEYLQSVLGGLRTNPTNTPVDTVDLENVADTKGMILLHNIDTLEMAYGEKHKACGYILSPHKRLLHAQKHYLFLLTDWLQLSDDLGSDHEDTIHARDKVDTLHGIIMEDFNKYHPGGFHRDEIFYREEEGDDWVVNNKGQRFRIITD